MEEFPPHGRHREAPLPPQLARRLACGEPTGDAVRRTAEENRSARRGRHDSGWEKLAAYPQRATYDQAEAKTPHCDEDQDPPAVANGVQTG